MAYLQQRIMGVPGLTGSSFQRQKQYYERLGAPQGPYRGTRTQNMWLLGQLDRPDFGMPQAAPAPAPAPAPTPLPQQFAEMAGAKDVYKGPVFSEVLPFYKAWGKLMPTAEEEARSIIDPFVQRQLGQQTRQFQMGLARTGGGRFGRALGGRGAIEAEAERQRSAQILDWIGQRRAGFESLFYEPAEKAWTRAIELGQKPTTPEIPTWEKYQKQYQTQLG